MTDDQHPAFGASAHLIDPDASANGENRLHA
jgi:hypothetical protein